MLPPIDPVAPSNVTDRGPLCALDVLAPLILLTRPRAARCRIGAAAQHANDSCHQRGGDKAVQAIHHATVAGNRDRSYP